MTKPRIVGLVFLFAVVSTTPTLHAEPEEPGSETIDSSTTAQFEAEVAAYEGREQRAIDKEAAAPLESFGAALVQMVVVLVFVCLLAYFLLGKVLPKLMRVQQPTAGQTILEVVDRLPLDARRSIMVIKLGERYFMIGATESGISLLSRIEAEEIQDALAAAQVRRESKSLGRFASGLLGRTRGER